MTHDTPTHPYPQGPPATEEEEAGVDELMVVTIVLVVAAPLQLPPIRTPGDAKSCLQALGAVKRSKLEALEVLWTPQAEDGLYTDEELRADYPDLKPLPRSPFAPFFKWITRR
jgi:uncharacterized membrane protein